MQSKKNVGARTWHSKHCSKKGLLITVAFQLHFFLFSSFARKRNHEEDMGELFVYSFVCGYVYNKPFMDIYKKNYYSY